MPGILPLWRLFSAGWGRGRTIARGLGRLGRAIGWRGWDLLLLCIRGWRLILRLWRLWGRRLIDSMILQQVGLLSAIEFRGFGG